MGFQKQRQRNWRQSYTGIVPSVYRLVAYTVAATQLMLSPPTHPAIVPPLTLVIGVGLYTATQVLHHLRGRKSGAIWYGAVGLDIAVCIFLVLVTEDIRSPFLAYTLVPVLTISLVLNSRVAIGIAGLSVGYVIAAHMVHPLEPPRPPASELSHLLIYMMAVSMCARLPYQTNVNLRQHLQSKDVLGERQRVSREIHDGTAQTLSALRWQIQLVQRRLDGMGVDLAETDELARVAARADQEVRTAMKLLRGPNGDGSLSAHLEDHLKNWSQQTGIDPRLDVELGETRLEPSVELELTRICQEALANIARHSGAHDAHITITPANARLEVSIADDGCGFDATAYYRNEGKSTGHGLAIMRERAESVGGRLLVLSMPGKGTDIQVELPVKSNGRSWSWLKG